MPAAVDVLIEAPGWAQVDLEALAQAAADATLAHLGADADSFEISVLGCDDARIAVLNAEFRGKPAPTNVLSWPSADRAASRPGAVPDLPAPDETGACELGDIAIADGVCAAEARAQGIAMGQHVTHLLVHGMLHLLGYDHVDDADASLMERMETEILASMGLPDPY